MTQPTAIFSSWHGRYSDSPRAISRELRRVRPDVRQVWLLADDAAQPPEYVERVARGTAEELSELEAAEWIVSNDVLPMDFEKRPGAVYMQTWHGTPLKRIGFDVRNATFPGAEHHYAVELGRDVARWDMLLSPNPASSEILRAAFRFGGPVLELGLPRNDALLAAGREHRRRAVRDQLGLEPGTLAVLYAPTWRDDFQMTLELDLEAVHGELSERAVVLVRAHGLTAARSEIATTPGSRDVTRWADVADLYLAADVLLTDYSSAMVDFAITGKPQLFYTYDLEDYRDRLRGFYVDFERVVPGPLLATTQDVIEALRNLDEVSRAHRPAYRRFVERYCPLDDGLAGKRAVRALLGRDANDASVASPSSVSGRGAAA